MPELSTNIEVSIDFEVYCDRCGAGICSNTTVTTSRNRGYPQLRIEPCEKCLAEATKEGYADGYAEGKESCDA